MNEMKWIPTNEALPPRTGLYLATVEVDAQFSAAIPLEYVDHRWTMDGKDLQNEVTAWMNLPDPYRAAPEEDDE